MNEPGIEIHEEQESSGGGGALTLGGIGVVLAGLTAYLAFGDLWDQLLDQSGGRRGGILRIITSIGYQPLMIVLGVLAVAFLIGAVVVFVRGRKEA